MGSCEEQVAPDGLALTNSEGYPLLDTNGSAIVLPATTDVSKLTVDADGRIFEEVQVEVEVPVENPEATEGEGNEENPGGEQVTEKIIKTEYVERARLGIVQFNNPSGLEKVSGSLYQVTAASGEPRMEVEDTALKRSSIRSGYLEASNVQTVDEIVNLIVAQRAYEMNSKVITASDQMLQQANNLRG